jgi:IclR helix-turn-helix domain
MLSQSLLLPKQRLIPQSFGRTLLLLTEFGTHGNRGARFTDLIAETNVATATFRRLLAAMIRTGFVEQDALTFVPSTVVAPHLVIVPGGDPSRSR